MQNKVSVGLVQMHCSELPEENLTKAVTAIQELADRGAQIICLPELFLGPYFCQERDKKYFALAEAIPGPNTQSFQDLAREKQVVILASLYELAEDGHRFNTVAVIDADGSLLGKYRKIHVPNDPEYGYDETYYFSQGDLGFQVFQTRYARVSPMVCYDQWFPEGARMCGVKGAQILFYPTAIGWPLKERLNKAYFDRAEHEAWQVTQRSHAIDNHLFVAAVNRVQPEKGLNFWGTSFVCDPYGV
ncbi:MAG: nitrilase-related carbon-nitrogen hydrolase, partial [bacterium]|nr:nitrilase-related carbon-nitrogen hydrolase [bacterium]